MVRRHFLWKRTEMFIQGGTSPHSHQEDTDSKGASIMIFYLWSWLSMAQQVLKQSSYSLTTVFFYVIHPSLVQYTCWYPLQTSLELKWQIFGYSCNLTPHLHTHTWEAGHNLWLILSTHSLLGEQGAGSKDCPSASTPNINQTQDLSGVSRVP